MELLIFPALHYLELEDLVELLIFLTWGPTLHYGLTLRGVAFILLKEAPQASSRSSML